MKFLRELMNQNITERVDTFLDRLEYQFTKVLDPMKMLDQPDASLLAKQIAGLQYIIFNKESLLHNSKLHDFSELSPDAAEKKLFLLLSEIDDVEAANRFNERTQDADQFMAYIGSTFNMRGSSDVYHQLLAIKRDKNNNNERMVFVQELNRLHREFSVFYAELKRNILRKRQTGFIQSLQNT